MAAGTDGEIPTFDASGNPAFVATGTSGQVLTSNGAGTAPTMQTAAGGGDVSKVGTPVNSQIGVWTGDGTIEGASSLTYDGSNFQLTGDIGATGTRITKGWFTDLQVTNAIAGSITGNAATVTTITGLAPDTATTQATQPNITSAAALPWTGMAAGTDGEIPTFDASGNPAFVATGTSGQVLTSNGAGTAPTMQAAGGSAYFADDGGSPGTAPSATGSGAIAIGDDALATTPGSFVVGFNANATTSTQATNVCIGSMWNNSTGDNSNTASGDGSISIAAGGWGNTTGDTKMIASGTSAILIGSSFAAAGTSVATRGLASGNQSIAIGANQAQASATTSVAIGTGAQATGSASIVISGQSSLANNGATNSVHIGAGFGNSNFASTFAVGVGAAIDIRENYQAGFGSNVRLLNHGENCVALGAANTSFKGIGQAQFKLTYFPSITTTDATPTVLSNNGATLSTDNRIKIPTDFSAGFRGIIIGKVAAGNTSAFEITGCIKNNSGTTSLVGTPTVTVLGEDAAGTDLTVAADDTNDTLSITVTGIAANTYSWTGYVDMAFLKT